MHSSIVIICTTLLVLTEFQLCPAQRMIQICAEYFENTEKDREIKVLDDGSKQVGDVLFDLESLSNSPMNLSNVDLKLFCPYPFANFILLNRTKIVLNQSVTALPCSTNVNILRCRIVCDKFAHLDYVLPVAILRTDHADPYFMSSSYTAPVSEGPWNGVILVRTNGDIILEKHVDYDSGITSYSYNVSVMHTGKRAYTNLTIEVIDEDDMDPAFTKPVYMLKIPENNATLTSMWLDTEPPIHAEDLDKGHGRQKLSYFFTDLNIVNEEFELNPLTGKIRVNVTLDRERKEFYVYGIKAQQDNDHLRSATATLSITVLDVNDNVPVFTHQSHDISINEHPRIGMSVTSVTAKDADQAENAAVLYRIDKNNYFEIDGKSGLVTVRSSSALDREKSPNVTVTIRAFDNESGHEGGNTTLKVTLLDINDNAPVFTQQNYSFILSSSSLFVGRVKANDDDIGNNAVISYSLFDSLDSKLFHVDQEGNIARSDVPPDKESFTVIVFAKDHGYPQLQSMASITITMATAALRINRHRIASLKKLSHTDPPNHAVDPDKDKDRQTISYLFTESRAGRIDIWRQENRNQCHVPTS